MVEVAARDFVPPPNEVHRALRQDVVLGKDCDPDAGQEGKVEDRERIFKKLIRIMP